MPDSSNKGNGFDWSQMEKWMKQAGLTGPAEMLQQPEWIEKFVGQVLKKTLPANALSIAGMPGVPAPAKPRIFATHHFVIVQFKLGSRDHPDNYRLLVRPDRVKLQADTDERTQRAKLPCQIVPESCRALFKDGVLQVKLRKRRMSSQYYEAPIRT
ncbi:hypothetical protein EBB07_30040 [Paenibacillaceae bacterium]|nr:hypothetical protein EBB07_30040 [Paenibacillaceae bacterium]